MNFTCFLSSTLDIDSVCCFDVQMTNDEFWPFYTEKLSDFDPTLVILLLLVTVYCCIKCAQKSDWRLLFDFLSVSPVGIFQNFRSEFLELKKSDWIFPEKVDGLFFVAATELATDQAFVWLFVSWRLLLLKKTIIVLLWLKKYPGKTRCLLF